MYETKDTYKVYYKIKLKHLRLKRGSNVCCCVTIFRLGLLLQGYGAVLGGRSIR